MNIPSAGHGAPSSPGGRQSAGRGGVLPVVASMVMLLTVLSGTAGPASAATSAPGRVTFGIEPASATGPDGRANFSFAMTPGAVLFDNLAVVNYSSVPLSLQLYATDALETSGGGFGLLQPTVKPSGVGAWISLPPSSSTVQVPAERPTGPGYLVVPMTVHVPLSTSPGDHVGGIIASLRTVGTNATGQTVVLNQRIGSRVFIRVAGTLTPQLTLTALHATYAGSSNPVGTGKLRVSYIVTNSGDANLAVHDQQVSVSGIIGDTDTSRLNNLALLLPGASVTQSVAVPGVWPQFRLHQTVSVQPVLYGGSSATLSPVSASTTLWVMPWLLLLLILVVILIVLAVVWARRRSRRTPDLAPTASADVVEDSTAKAEVPA